MAQRRHVSINRTEQNRTERLSTVMCAGQEAPKASSPTPPKHQASSIKRTNTFSIDRKQHNTTSVGQVLLKKTTTQRNTTQHNATQHNTTSVGQVSLNKRRPRGSHRRPLPGDLTQTHRSSDREVEALDHAPHRDEQLEVCPLDGDVGEANKLVAYPKCDL